MLEEKIDSIEDTVDEDRSYCVYMHTNKINGKKYIGQTCKPKPEYRWNKDGKGYYRQPYFYSEIKEYGWDNFDTEIIESNLTHKEANILESKLIVEYDTMNSDKGYNLQAGGSGYCKESYNEDNKSFINKQNCIPLKDKYLLTVEEVCSYTGLESSKVDKILNNKNEIAVLIDSERYIIRNKLEEYFEHCAKYQINI